MAKKILYLECFSGISGDMTVGALLDLGADREVLEKSLESLNVDGYEIHIGRTKKCGLDACDFDVQIPSQPDYDEGHGHHHHGEEHGHCHGEEQENWHEHHHEGECCHGHGHHHHGEEHGHCHEHGHHHAHEHRNINDVFEIIDRLDNERVKTLAKRMFMIVAEAESKAHGLPIDQVHFHEVGAIDSIVDIISAAVCVDNLDVDEVVVSELYEGHGHVRCQHGMIPVPVPATANIVMANKLAMRMTDAWGEMVTPTGAAIAAALRNRETLPKHYRLVKIGLGAGKKDFAKANVLRAMLLEEQEEIEATETSEVVLTEKLGDKSGEKFIERMVKSSEEAENLSDKSDENIIKRTVEARTQKQNKDENIWKLESNIDDCSGEIMGYAMERLLAAGARDAWYVPIYMKKNRPAYMLNVLCDEKMIAMMEDIIFTETTTIGVRRYPVERTVMMRAASSEQTSYGCVLVKVCQRQGKTYIYPEYESVKEVCVSAGVAFKTVYQAACEAVCDM